MLSTQDLQNKGTSTTNRDSYASSGVCDGYSQTPPAQVEDTPELSLGAPVVHGIEPSHQAPADAGLVDLIHRWPDLPEHIRRQILAIAQGQDHAPTCDQQREGDNDEA